MVVNAKGTSLEELKTQETRKGRFKWRGIEVRLGLALAMLSMATLLLALFSSVTYDKLESALVELKEKDIVALEHAARLNDMVRLVISDASQLADAESNLERRNTMTRVDNSIQEMNQILVHFPEYHAYFKDLMMQVNNSLSLLYQSAEDSRKLNAELRNLLEGFYPLLQQVIDELDKLPASDKSKLQYGQLKALLFYQLGLVEKLFNDGSFNELDYTTIRLEQLGEEWFDLWQASGLAKSLPALDEKLSVIYTLASRSSHLVRLKNQALEHHYQQAFLLENSREYLHQLSIQIERNTSNVNLEIDQSIAQVQQSLASNRNFSLTLSVISLIAAAGIAWFYVRKNILERLLHLRDEMFAISTGHLDTEIALRGQDEITQMAKSLKVFQATAKVVKRTNKKLEAEVEERRLAEERLRVTQNELVQAGKLAALGQLSVGITHEINQPLTAISSHTRSAQKWLEQERTDKALQNLLKIEMLLSKVAALTHHLKAFSRKSDGKISPVEVMPVINDAIALFVSRDVPIALDCHLDQTQSVIANPIRLEQVLVNLLSNAVDAVENTENPLIVMSVNCDEEGVSIKVKDNGKGIPSEDIPHIFDPFYTRKDVGKGLGLGLSIAFNIIKDFGGSIRVYSQPGQGSEFVVHLEQG
ncbi:Sensor protein torS [Grimontia indica]|uniref:C4-dicarboxylate transport sensor protein DctB n=1 Tax=Grimontia indica TaxID=1056512 RepID=R1GY47_9GAMM|nr:MULTISPECIES: ATP-binding protein [Grimontia]EOD80964.1 Sensor protein torS [Grimontia indica]